MGNAWLERGRWIVALAAVIVVAALYASLSWQRRHSGGRELTPLAVLSSAADFNQHRPDGDPVVVDRSVPGWASLAWLTVDARVCVGTVGVSGPGRGHAAFTCAGSTPFGGTDLDVVQKPAFQALPGPPDSGGRALAIGNVRDDVATVELTFRGRHATATTHPVSSGGQVRFSVYAVWLPLGGATSYGSRDITDVTGRNAAGVVVGYAS